VGEKRGGKKKEGAWALPKQTSVTASIQDDSLLNHARLQVSQSRAADWEGNHGRKKRKKKKDRAAFGRIARALRLVRCGAARSKFLPGDGRERKRGRRGSGSRSREERNFLQPSAFSIASVRFVDALVQRFAVRRGKRGKKPGSVNFDIAASWRAANLDRRGGGGKEAPRAREPPSMACNVPRRCFDGAARQSFCVILRNARERRKEKKKRRYGAAPPRPLRKPSRHEHRFVRDSHPRLSHSA